MNMTLQVNDEGRRKFGPDFRVSFGIVVRLKPFHVKHGKRECCMCVHCLRWALLAESLFAFRKRNRSKNHCNCNFTNHKSNRDSRRSMICPRDPPEGRCDLFPCVNGTCVNCGDMHLWKLCPCVEVEDNKQLDVDHETKWEQHQTVTCVLADGTEKSKRDFVKKVTNFDEFRSHFEQHFRTFLLHHDLAKFQEDAMKFLRGNVERGKPVTIEDFSENYHIQAKREAQSAHFSQVSATMHGCGVHCHIDDAKFVSEENKRKFRALGRTVVFVSHLVMSNDLKHDWCFVQHVNDTMLTPWLKTNLLNVTQNIKVTDGAPQHFKHSCNGGWMSLCHQKHGIKLRWVVGAAGHRKDVMDGEGGQAKNKADGHQISESGMGESTAIQNAKDFYKFVKTQMSNPGGDHFKRLQKKETPVHLRVVHWLPARGEGSVPRLSMRKCDTLVGIKGYCHFTDLKKPFVLGCRRRFCHCEHCSREDYKSCKHLDRCGPIIEVKMKLLPLDHFFAVDVEELSEAGTNMAQESKLGDFTAVETIDDSEPFFLCRNMTGDDIGPCDVEDHIDSMNGHFVPGDVVIDVVKLEPVAPGSRTHVLTDKSFPVHTKNIRKTKVKLQLQERRRSGRTRSRCAPRTTYELPVEEQEAIFSELRDCAAPS